VGSRAVGRGRLSSGVPTDTTEFSSQGVELCPSCTCGFAYPSFSRAHDFLSDRRPTTELDESVITSNCYLNINVLVVERGYLPYQGGI
jgi:hypothetical protein